MRKADKFKSYKLLISKQHLQVSGLYDIPFLSYSQKHLTQIYKAQYGNTMLVSHWLGTNMAAGNHREHLALIFAIKSRTSVNIFSKNRSTVTQQKN